MPEQPLEAQKGSKPFPKLPNSNSKPFPKDIEPLLKNSFSTIFQGPGPGEAPFARAAPGSPEGKQAFAKIAKFKLQAFPGSLLQQAVPEQPLEAQKGSKPFPKLPNSNSKPFPKDIEHLLKNSFSTIFQGPGPGEAPFARAAPGSPEGKQAFAKIAKFKLQAFPKGANPLLNPY